MSCYDYHRKTTPFIDHLAKEGILFTNTFANGPFTAASFISILASRYPLEFEEMLPLPKNATLFSQILRKNGIKTAAIHSNPYLSTVFGYNRGWNYFMDFLNHPHTKRKKINKIEKIIKKFIPKIISDVYFYSKLSFGFQKFYENAEDITSHAIQWIEKNQNNSFFLWIHYMDTHEPYIKSRKQKTYSFSKNISKILVTKILLHIENKIFSKDVIDTIMDLYDDNIKYIDKNIKNLYDYLEKNNLTSNTILIITSDHGQQFLDHGEFGHTAFFYDELLHIPLIIHGRTSKKSNQLVQHLDIAPTILSIFGLTPPSTYLGQDLFSLNDTYYVISETAHNAKGVYIEKNVVFPSHFKSYSIRTKDWKYIVRKNTEELYNLRKDPKEKKNLSHVEHERIKVFQTIIQDHIRKEKEVIERRRIKNKLNTLKKQKKL
jgi:arylsulfatase A-like enzyme